MLAKSIAKQGLLAISFHQYLFLKNKCILELVTSAEYPHMGLSENMLFS